jgi:hypothetical protein
MRIYIFYAKLKRVRSMRFLKKGRFWNIFLFDSLRNYILRPLGNFSTKKFSYSWLNFFLMLEDSSM